jgi:hypothetical protein
MLDIEANRDAVWQPHVVKRPESGRGGIEVNASIKKATFEDRWATRAYCLNSRLRERRFWKRYNRRKYRQMMKVAE